MNSNPNTSTNVDSSNKQVATATNNNNHQLAKAKPSDTNDANRLATNASLSTPSNGTMKNHKVEGKNKKSLHQKQHQQQQQQKQQQQQSSFHSQQRKVDSTSVSSGTSANNRRAIHQKNNPTGSIKLSGATVANSTDHTNVCTTLEDFSKRAQELKGDINKALEKQKAHQIIDQPMEVVKLKEDILKLSGLDVKSNLNANESRINKNDNTCLSDTERVENSNATESDVINKDEMGKNVRTQTSNQASSSDTTSEDKSNQGSEPKKQSKDDNNSKLDESKSTCTIELSPKDRSPISEKVGDKNKSTTEDHATGISQLQLNQTNLIKTAKSSPKKRNPSDDQANPQKKSTDIISEGFEPLNAKLDLDTKYVTLVSSLQKHFTEAPYLLEPVCRRLVSMSEENDQLTLNCEKYQAENAKLSMIKQKLENLCRELQKSNNAIRIESLDLIKVEQGKAKEQTTKIQSTLSGVIKLFDENQQRNMSLRQENQDLQTKLKSLLDHCDNWEKSVEAALRQKDIENRLLKTELAKSNLLKNEEKEKFLGEKQELLQILSMMQEQQHRIEGQEAKLRMDLSCYASKYDECQAVISKGMTRFQTESERMLKQIERSKEDYKILLSKYESSNKKMAQLLEEKQYWDKAMNLANKKIDTLEKLCRALRERKSENKNDNRSTPSSNKSKGKAISNKSEVPTAEQVREFLSKANTRFSTSNCETDRREKTNIETGTRDKNLTELNLDQIQTSDSNDSNTVGGNSLGKMLDDDIDNVETSPNPTNGNLSKDMQQTSADTETL